MINKSKNNIQLLLINYIFKIVITSLSFLFFLSIFSASIFLIYSFSHFCCKQNIFTILIIYLKYKHTTH